MAWCFRLRAWMGKAVQAKDLPGIVRLEGFPRIEVDRQPLPQAIADPVDGRTPGSVPGNYVTFVSREFDNEDSAWEAGKAFSTALLLWGAINHVGVNVGFDEPSGQFSEAIKSKIRELSGTELKSETLGLMTYEKDSVTIIRVSGEIKVEVPLASFQQQLSDWLPHAASISMQHRICAELLNDAHRVPHIESRFILATAAIEALCEPDMASKEKARAIDALAETLSKLSLDPALKHSLGSLLGSARKESIAAACKRKVSERVGPAEAERFYKLYGLRSAFVHSGKGRGSLQDEASSMMQIAIRLLESDIKNAKLRRAQKS